MERSAMMNALPKLELTCRAGLAAVLALLTACSGETCNMAGCQDGFEIRAVSSGPLPAGRYDIAIGFGARSGTCTAFVPSSAGSTNCDESLPVSVTALDAALLIVVHDDPNVVTVRVDRDDQTIGEDDFEPDYRTVEPNGPSCEPTCRVADGEELLLAP